AEIRTLVEQIDSTASSAMSELRVISLRYALADVLSNTILGAIAQGVQQSPVGISGIVATPAGARPPGTPGLPGAPLAALPGTGAAAATATGAIGTGGLNRSLRFVGPVTQGRPVESGYLEDIRLVAYTQTNAIIVSAPNKGLELVLALIAELDKPPLARA